jgi:hypothetical protein
MLTFLTNLAVTLVMQVRLSTYRNKGALQRFDLTIERGTEKSMHAPSITTLTTTAFVDSELYMLPCIVDFPGLTPHFPERLVISSVLKSTHQIQNELGW